MDVHEMLAALKCHVPQTRELADFLKLQRQMGKEPTNDDLQRQGRIIIYEFDDGWN